MKVIFYIVVLNMVFGLSLSKADTIVKTDFETISKGSLYPSEVGDGQRVIEIYNKQEWTNLWNKYLKDPISTPVAPNINFEEYSVLVAIDNTRGSGGYTIEIKEITVDTAVENRPFTVTLELQQPGSAAATDAVITRPYHMVKIKK